jgi:hypothetical protein
MQGKEHSQRRRPRDRQKRNGTPANVPLQAFSATSQLAKQCQDFADSHLKGLEALALCSGKADKRANAMRYIVPHLLAQVAFWS